MAEEAVAEEDVTEKVVTEKVVTEKDVAEEDVAEEHVAGRGRLSCSRPRPDSLRLPTSPFEGEEWGKKSSPIAPR